MVQMHSLLVLYSLETGSHQETLGYTNCVVNWQPDVAWTTWGLAF